MLLLSSYLDARYAATLFASYPAGTGYLLKERVGDAGVLSDALRRIAHGECVLDPAIVNRLLNRAREPGPLDELSPREREILALMAEGHSNRRIMRALRPQPEDGREPRPQHLHQARPARDAGQQPARARRAHLPARLTSGSTLSQVRGTACFGRAPGGRSFAAMRNPALSIALVTSLIAAAGANAAAPHRLCVGRAEGCYANIQPAVDAAHDGDTIAVGRGTFAGGVMIDKSIRLEGAGAQATRIVGGGPVLTLGAFDAADEPTISVDGVTIARGRTTSSPLGDWRALGGGVFIPPAADSNVGATVTITDSIIARNETAPATTFPSPSGAHCPDGDCPYAEADGGGIDNWGTLTLDRVAVAHNRSAGPVTSDADGAGIYSHLGDLTIRRSAIDDNSAVAVPPNARFAEGGGVFVEGGRAEDRRELAERQHREPDLHLPVLRGRRAHLR